MGETLPGARDGVGGQPSPERATRGATAVQIGTANFKEPGIAKRLVEELSTYCVQRGIAAASLVGRAQAGRAPARDAGAEG